MTLGNVTVNKVNNFIYTSYENEMMNFRESIGITSGWQCIDPISY